MTDIPPSPHWRHLLCAVPALTAAFAIGAAYGFQFPGDIFAETRHDWHTLTWICKRIHDIYKPLIVCVWGALLIDGIRRHDKDQTRFCLWLALVIVAAYAAVTLLKDGIGMPRPGFGTEARPWSGMKAFHSLPSGTTSMTASLLFPTALWLHRTQISAAIGAYALATVLSRLWLCKHHPADVIAGLAVGLLVTAAVFALFRLMKRRE